MRIPDRATHNNVIRPIFEGPFNGDDPLLVTARFVVDGSNSRRDDEQPVIDELQQDLDEAQKKVDSRPEYRRVEKQCKKW